MEAMAANVRREATALVQQLCAEGPLFEFSQLVATFELLGGTGTSEVGSGANAAPEPVTFASNPRISFVSGEIEAILEPKGAGSKPTVLVNFMGVSGAVGPLPLPFAELVLSRVRKGDYAGRDFLDLFHHRLISLVYRIHKRHFLGLGVSSPEQTHAANYLLSLVGLGTPGMIERSRVVSHGQFSSRSLLYYAGLFAREVRTMSALECMLSTQFNVPVEGSPLVGAYFSVEPNQRTHIGRSGQNRMLGCDALLGARYWDQEASFDIRVGPLDVSEYVCFLPGGDRLAALFELTQQFVGPTLDFRVWLLLDPEAASARRQSKSKIRGHQNNTQRLGKTAWLGRTVWVGRSWQKRSIVVTRKTLQAAAPKSRAS